MLTLFVLHSQYFITIRDHAGQLKSAYWLQRSSKYNILFDNGNTCFVLFGFWRMHILFAVVFWAVLVLCHTSSDLNHVWGKWRIQHHKNYDNQVGLCSFFNLHKRTHWRSCHAVTGHVSDWDCLQESGVGKEFASGAETQPRGLRGKAQLQAGAEPPGWHGETRLQSNSWCFWSLQLRNTQDAFIKSEYSLIHQLHMDRVWKHGNST